jgi:hypothetical protein
MVSWKERREEGGGGESGEWEKATGRSKRMIFVGGARRGRRGRRRGEGEEGEGARRARGQGGRGRLRSEGGQGGRGRIGVQGGGREEGKNTQLIRLSTHYGWSSILPCSGISGVFALVCVFFVLPSIPPKKKISDPSCTNSRKSYLSDLWTMNTVWLLGFVPSFSPPTLPFPPFSLSC